MKSGKFFIFIIIAAMLAVVFSCKKKEADTPRSKSFSGKLKFSVPSFVKKGESVKMIPNGVYRADKGDFGYFWSITPKIAVKKDTVKKEGMSGDGAYNFVVPDTIGTFTVSCSAFAKSYYNANATVSFAIVNDEKSIDIKDYSTLPKINDARDGKTYPYVSVGNTLWMSRNMAFEEKGKPYASCKAMADVFGMYYTGEEADEVCPSGWRLPSVADWKALCENVSGNSGDDAFLNAAGGLMANAYFNKVRMWEFWPAVKITNKSGFCAIPTGYASVGSGGLTFEGYKSYAAYWASDFTAGGKRQYVYIYEATPDLMVGSVHKGAFAASVRCIKDK